MPRLRWRVIYGAHWIDLALVEAVHSGRAVRTLGIFLASLVLLFAALLHTVIKSALVVLLQPKCKQSDGKNYYNLSEGSRGCQ